MKWDLSCLYESFESQKYKDDFLKLKESIVKLIKFLEDFNDICDDEAFILKFEKFFIDYEEINKLYITICNFINLTISSNLYDKDARNEDLKIKDIGVTMVPINTLIIKIIGKRKDILNLIHKSDILKEYEFVIKEYKDSYKYLLSDESEKLISELNNFGALSFSDMQCSLVGKYSVKIKQKEGYKEIPLTEARTLLQSSCKEVRESAFKGEKELYKYMGEPVSYALNNIKKSVIFSCKKRGYESPLHKSLQDSRISYKTFESLIDVMKESLPFFRDFLKHKAKLLGYKNNRIKFMDMFAPIGESSEIIDFNFSKDFINKTFSSFSEKLGDFSKKAFDNNWIDSEIYKGKVGGAFCSNIIPIKESRILMSYGNSYDSLFTLAHELGHAYHGEVLKDENILNTYYPMPIAETASIFCENLVSDKAIEISKDKDKLIILEYELSSASQVIVDIYSRFLFEKEVFIRCENEFLSFEDLNDIMLRAQKEAYGDSMDEEYFKEAWIYKSHYYDYDYNFYNFPYAFGLLFSLGLYKMYLDDDTSFHDKYEVILKNSGKKNLEDLCMLVDIDITDKQFFRDSIKILKDKYNKFLELSKKLC